MSQKTILKNLKNILSWTILSQLIAVAAYPIITRLFDSITFGEYGVFIALVSILSSCSTFRVEMSIPISKKVSILNSNIQLSFVINLIFSLCLFFVIFILSYQFNFLDPISIFLGVFLFGVFRVLNMSSLFYSDFKVIGLAKFTQIGSMVTFQVLLGSLFATKDVLVFGFIFGYLSAIFLFYVKSKVQFFYSKKVFYKESFCEKLKAKSKYIKYDTPAILINTLSNEVPSLFLPLLYGLSSGGYYIMAYRILIVPVTLIGSTLGQVILSHSVKWKSSQVLYCNLKRILVPLIGITVVLAIPTIIWVERVFIFILGEEWTVTANLMSILCISTFSQFIYSPFSTLVQLLNIQQFNFKFYVFLLLIKILIINVCYFVFDFMMTETIIVLSVISLVFYSYFVFNVLKFAKASDCI